MPLMRYRSIESLDAVLLWRPRASMMTCEHADDNEVAG